MRIPHLVAVFAAACVMSAAPVIVRAAQGTAKTTRDGIYTNAQARTGETLYADKCAQCHGPNAEGENGPPLVGAVFATGWDGIALSDLFDRMRATAPASNPGSLSRDEVAALMSYLLELNDFPSGTSDLPNAPELLKPIRFAFTTPDGSR